MMEPTWQTADGSVQIYALSDPRIGVVRYVGKTIATLSRRVTQHLAECKKGRTHRRRWLLKLRREGVRPTVTLLETVAPGGDWSAAERKWIGYFRRAGCPLVNATDGGEGLAGHAFSEEHRRKISEALRNSVSCDCLNCGHKFDTKPSAVANGNGRFCCRTCYSAWQRGRAKNCRPSEAAIANAALARRAQTHCKLGHPLSGENLFITSGGGRGCKECRKIHKRAYRARHGC